MVDHFMNASGQNDKAFIDDNPTLLIQTIKSYLKSNRKLCLFGVSYAILDFAMNHGPIEDHILIIETGGMKGRGKEMVKEELHKQILKGFPNASIHSEYGMTELQSQFYARDGMNFMMPFSAQVHISEINDPFSKRKEGKTGLINIIDLANLDTISFIETQDIGKLDAEGRLQIMGRLDHSDIRGCNLLYV